MSAVAGDSAPNSNNNNNNSNPSSHRRRQLRMGPAPIASFEDLADEDKRQHQQSNNNQLQQEGDNQQSPTDATIACVVRLPGIREDPTTPSSVASLMATPTPTPMPGGISLIGSLHLPGNEPDSSSSNPPPSSAVTMSATPRIDISRASSSSQHDENNSSSPELRQLFDDNTAKEGSSAVSTRLGFGEDGTADLRSSTEELDFHEPQDRAELLEKMQRSQSPLVFRYESELPQQPTQQRKDSQSSEIGLLCISGRTSRLSSIGSQCSSNQSRRSPSPSKMLLETSFCGTKAKPTPNPSIVIDTPQPAVVQAKQPEVEIEVEAETRPYPATNLRPGETIVSESGVEYTFIPLKGPLPQPQRLRMPASREKHAATKAKHSAARDKHSKQPVSSNDRQVVSRDKHSGSRDKTPSGAAKEPEYIRIKLKPDHMYPKEDQSQPDSTSSSAVSVPKPATLDLSRSNPKPPQSFSQIIKNNTTTGHSNNTLSPKISKQQASAATKELVTTTTTSRSPSPALSRKNSFASLFRSRETISPAESPHSNGAVSRRRSKISTILKEAGESLITRGERSRSKSRERDNSKATPTKSSVLSLFGGKKSQASAAVSKPAVTKEPARESKDLDIRFRFPEGESIRIPLHTPSYYENRTILSDTTEPEPTLDDKTAKAIVFSTKLGSRDAIFSTDLPQKQMKQENGEQHQAKQENGERQPVEQENGERDTAQEVDKLREAAVAVVDQVFRDATQDARCNIAETVVGLATERLLLGQSHDNKAPGEAEGDGKERVSGGEVELDSQGLDLPNWFAESKESQERGSVVLEHNQVLGLSNESQDSSNLVLEHGNAVPDHSSDSSSDCSPRPDDPAPPLETKRLFLHPSESFDDDDLPYVPTTLPQERSLAMPIVPVKQRAAFDSQLRPIERPRSATPLAQHSTCLLDEYQSTGGGQQVGVAKLKISLPRCSTTTTTTTATVEKPPPTLVPNRDWINFEEIPERRKPAKRIQTIPQQQQTVEDQQTTTTTSVVYSYVNPEDCKCECHEVNKKREKPKTDEDDVEDVVEEDEMPLLLGDEAGEEAKR